MEDDFLRFHCDNEELDQEEQPETQAKVKKYYDRSKPNWWYKLCLKPTKPQRKATREVLATHIRLADVPYGAFFDWETVFPTTSTTCEKSIWLEIGFGRGENLLALAYQKRHNTNIALIGAEMNQLGVGVCCQRIREGMASNKYWTGFVSNSDVEAKQMSAEPSPGTILEPTKTCENDDNDTSHDDEPPYQNLRIYPGEGIRMLTKVPDSSLSAVMITFPDPFAKDHYQQHRIIQLDTARQMHRCLRKGTGLLYLSTDHPTFHAWSQAVMNQLCSGGDGDDDEKEVLFVKEPWHERSEWLPAVSRYEQKGWDEGRKTMLSCWRAL